MVETLLCQSRSLFNLLLNIVGSNGACSPSVGSFTSSVAFVFLAPRLEEPGWVTCLCVGGENVIPVYVI